jgi:para-aminobenzoate synthetase component I
VKGEPLHTSVTAASLQQAAVRVICDAGTGMLLATGGTVADPYGRWDTVAALGAEHTLTIPFNDFSGDPFGELQRFLGTHPGWCFFLLSYDLKNSVENLSSSNTDRIMFPELVAFVPRAVVATGRYGNTTWGDTSLVDELFVTATKHHVVEQLPETAVTPVITRQQYLDAVEGIRHHIHMGDIYELNFCREFFGELPRRFAPEALWHRLFTTANAPFSVLFRMGDHLLCSASPERFLCRQNHRVIAQPMKGTIRRGADPGEDSRLMEQLRNDTKERSENVMITDLVRNDLSRIAARESVTVEELFGIYSFSTVHQMISTISAEPLPGTTMEQLLKATFPMGSMTGAPKVSAMQLIEQFESSRRGLYSGSVGYIDPDGHYDMNVVIRSIICNLSHRVCSFQTGGAITWASSPSGEYDESMLKANALIKALNANLIP